MVEQEIAALRCEAARTKTRIGQGKARQRGGAVGLRARWQGPELK